MNKKSYAILHLAPKPLPISLLYFVNLSLYLNAHGVVETLRLEQSPGNTWHTLKSSTKITFSLFKDKSKIFK